MFEKMLNWFFLKFQKICKKTFIYLLNSRSSLACNSLHIKSWNLRKKQEKQFRANAVQIDVLRSSTKFTKIYLCQSLFWYSCRLLICNFIKKREPNTAFFLSWLYTRSNLVGVFVLENVLWLLIKICESNIVSLRIKSECRKMRTRITTNMDTCYAVQAILVHDTW